MFVHLLFWSCDRSQQSWQCSRPLNFLFESIWKYGIKLPRVLEMDGDCLSTPLSSGWWEGTTEVKHESCPRGAIWNGLTVLLQSSHFLKKRPPPLPSCLGQQKKTCLCWNAVYNTKANGKTSALEGLVSAEVSYPAFRLFEGLELFINSAWWSTTNESSDSQSIVLWTVLSWISSKVSTRFCWMLEVCKGYKVQSF